MTSSKPEIFVVAIKDVGSSWISDPQTVANLLNTRFTKAGYKVNVIKSLAELDNLLDGTSRGIVFVNAHGEAIPCSQRWVAQPSRYVQMLGERARDSGWVIVSITGYPFYYIASGPDPQRIPVTEEKDGFGWFISSINAQVSGTVLLNCDLTPEGKSASALVNDIKFPDRIWISRCRQWVNIMPEKIFYGAGPLMGAGVVKFRTGYFICNFMWSIDLGTGPNKYSDEYLSKMSFSFIRDVIERISFSGLEEPRLNVMRKIARSMSSELSKARRVKDEKQLLKEVKRILELRFEELRFSQEKNCFKYSLKSYNPDFVSPNLNAVVEGKICTKNRRPATLIREINDYIIAFKTKYDYLLFVVYDVARQIKDPMEFAEDFEKHNPNVQVIVVKPN